MRHVADTRWGSTPLGPPLVRGEGVGGDRPPSGRGFLGGAFQGLKSLAIPARRDSPSGRREAGGLMGEGSRVQEFKSS